MANSFIKFGTFTCKLLYPLLTAFPCFCRYYFTTRLNYLPKHPLVYTLLMFISEILAGSLELITISLSTPEETEDILELPTNNTIIKIEESNQKKDQKWIVVCLIIITAVIDCFATTGTKIVSTFDESITNFDFEMKIALLFFTTLFSSLILNIIIYRHQFFSIFLVCIGIITISFHHIFSGDFFENILKALIYISLFCIYAIQNVVEHYLMRVKFISSFKLIFYEGMIGIILISILFSFLWVVPCHKDWTFCEGTIEDISSTIKQIFADWKVGLFLLGFLISSAIYNISIMLTNYYFTPTHRTISDMLTSLYIWLYIIILGKDNETGIWFILPIIGYISISFAVLIYHELIVLSCCNIDRDIKMNIIDRSIIEEKLYPRLIGNEMKLDNN